MRQPNFRITIEAHDGVMYRQVTRTLSNKLLSLTDLCKKTNISYEAVKKRLSRKSFAYQALTTQLDHDNLAQYRVQK